VEYGPASSLSQELRIREFRCCVKKFVLFSKSSDFGVPRDLADGRFSTRRAFVVNGRTPYVHDAPFCLLFSASADVHLNLSITMVSLLTLALILHLEICDS
jgi:hypothetical protein